MDAVNNKLILGWREWATLPGLGIPAIKAKVDTGARTSSLHTFRTDLFVRDGRDFVRFLVHPVQKNQKLVVECTAPLLDQRMVSDSGGHRELRYVIETEIMLAGITWQIEMTLTNRDTMRFRMLLGRKAMEGRTLVDPSLSYVNGKVDVKKIYNI